MGCFVGTFSDKQGKKMGDFGSDPWRSSSGSSWIHQGKPKETTRKPYLFIDEIATGGNERSYRLDTLRWFVSKKWFLQGNFKTLINKGFHTSRRAAFEISGIISCVYM
jgi:hypothetical protein